MDFSYDMIQVFDKAPPALDDPSAVAHQLRVPHTQCVLQVRELVHIPQQAVPVLHRLVVLVEVVQVGGIQLTQLHVHEASALRRPVFDDAQVLR